MFLSALHDLPYGFTCHAHDIFLDDHFIADKLDSATHAVTISKYNQQYLEKLYGNLADSMHIVHCGIDLTAYQFLQAGRNKAHIVAVGRLIPMKGFRVLIEALALLKSRNVDFQCDIVGDGPLRDDLTKLVDQNGLQEVLRLRGALPQEDVRGLIEKATVFVMPSTIANDGDRDGIPVALMEAMALGTPVLSTRVSGIPELLIDGKNGVLVDRDDSTQLAQGIEFLLNEPARAAQYAGVARESIAQEFNIEVEAEKLRDIFCASVREQQ
jgi:glycosyltransferase involved in cell wall biosynthesis